MEDGCAKRFDIGTLDLRTTSYDSLNPEARTISGPIPIGHLVPPPKGLPPMAIPPLGTSGILTSIPPSDLLTASDHHQNMWATTDLDKCK